MSGNNQNFVNPGVPVPAESPVQAATAPVQASQAVVGGTLPAPAEKAVAAQETTQEAPAVPQTPREKLQERIAKLQAKIARDTEALARLQSQLDNIDSIASIRAGVQVRAVIGRGDTKREVLAVVVGTKEVKGKTKVALYFGTGFDSQTAVIDTDGIIEVLQG